MRKLLAFLCFFVVFHSPLSYAVGGVDTVPFTVTQGQLTTNGIDPATWCNNFMVNNPGRYDSVTLSIAGNIATCTMNWSYFYTFSQGATMVAHETLYPTTTNSCPSNSILGVGSCQCNPGYGSIDGAICTPVCMDSGVAATIAMLPGFGMTTGGLGVAGGSFNACVPSITPGINCVGIQTPISTVFGVTLFRQNITRYACSQTTANTPPLSVTLVTGASPPVAFTSKVTTVCPVGTYTVTNQDGSNSCFPSYVGASTNSPTNSPVSPVTTVPAPAGYVPTTNPVPASNPFADSTPPSPAAIAAAGAAAGAAVAAAGGNASAVAAATNRAVAAAAGTPTDYARTGEAQIAANSINNTLNDTTPLPVTPLDVGAVSAVASTVAAFSQLSNLNSIITTDAIPMDTSFFTFPFQQTTCSPTNITVGSMASLPSQNVSIDFCSKSSDLQSIFAYVIYIITALILVTFITGGRPK